MNIEVNGMFVMKDSYNGLVDESTGKSLNSLIYSAFENGSVVRVHIEADYEGTKLLCQERTKYSRCGEILDADGNCPAEESHVKAEVTA